jgi:hypothetical protein
VEELMTSLGDDSIFHSDINKRNFLLDVDSGKVCIIDFQHIGVYPEAFCTFGLFNIGLPFASSVGRRLGYQYSTFNDKMAKVSGVLQQCGGNANFPDDRNPRL